MYKVVISPSANADLFNALKYIAYELENPSAAQKLADEVERCYADLEEMPSQRSSRRAFLPYDARLSFGAKERALIAASACAQSPIPKSRSRGQAATMCCSCLNLPRGFGIIQA